jgi:sensor histidine kinase YesM
MNIRANICIAGAAAAIAAIGLILSINVRYTKKYKKYLVTIFSMLTAYTVSNLVLWNVTNVKGGYMIVSYIFLFCESLFSSLILPVLNRFLLYCAEKNVHKNPMVYITDLLWAVYFVLLVTAQFTKWIYYYTPDNEYFRGPLYPVLLVPLVLLMAVNLFALFYYRAELSRRYRIAFTVYFLVPLLCMVVQMFYSDVLMTVLGSAASALIMLWIIALEQVERQIAQANEISKQRASIVVLQMRPHFIYNTMMSIYYLCKQNPDKAQQVTLEFTDYLRSNFTAIAGENAIPFTDELKHTQAYLSVEQAQHEDNLFVKFDTPHTMFRVPPLTLQPLVENAVKHGMDPDGNPLNISVTTRQTPSGSEIIVEDDGPGFSSTDNNDLHIALENIRQRLEMMCKGELEITPRDGGGTVVKVPIPASDR